MKRKHPINRSDVSPLKERSDAAFTRAVAEVTPRVRDERNRSGVGGPHPGGGAQARHLTAGAGGTCGCYRSESSRASSAPCGYCPRHARDLVSCPE